MNNNLKKVIEKMTFKKNSDEQLFTDAIDVEMQDDIDEFFDFYEVIDRTDDDERSYYNSDFFKKIANPLRKNETIRSCVFIKKNKNDKNINTRMLIMTNKNLFSQIKDIERDINNKEDINIVNIRKIDYDEACYYYKETSLLQLLLNGITYYKNENIRLQNEGWSLLEFNRAEKNVLIFNNFTIKFDADFGLLLSNNVKSFLKVSKDYYTNKSTKKAKFYEFENGQLSIFEGTEYKDNIYTDKAIKDKKNLISYATFDLSNEKQDLTKINKTGKILNLFNHVYEGIISISFKPFKNVTFLESNISTAKFNLISEELLKNDLPKILIDYDDSFEDTLKAANDIKNIIITEFKKAGYNDNSVKIQKGIAKEDTTSAIIRVISDPEKYKQYSINDAYHQISNKQLNVQHIIAQEKLSKEVVRNTMASLAIQMRVKNNDINLFEDVTRFNNFTFFIPYYEKIIEERIIKDEENSKKDDDKSEDKKNKEKVIYMLKRIDYLEIKNHQFNIASINEEDFANADNDMYNDLYNAITKNEISVTENERTIYHRFSWGMILPDGKCYISTPTGIGTVVPPKEFKNKVERLREVGVKSDNGENGGLRSEKNKLKLLRSMIDSGYIKINKNYYYYSHYRGKGIQKKLERRPNLHKIKNVNSSDDVMDKLLLSMAMPYNKNGELSVAPFPVKILRTLQ